MGSKMKYTIFIAYYLFMWSVLWGFYSNDFTPSWYLLIVLVFRKILRLKVLK